MALVPWRIPTFLKSFRSLCGGRNFRRVQMFGKRLEGELLKCSYLIEAYGASQIAAGFQVSSKTYSAVRRNRLKRLMRQGLRMESQTLLRILKEKEVGVSIILAYKGSSKVETERVMLDPIQSDFRAFCKAIAQKL